ncbi:hypothetical protein [Roseobacter sp. TSBP12]|uniref:hypothetical protein n=1 Tax=Roseobacter sp. TSBP12 TaxID=1236613 RepID=UPI0012600747|nr:hypothetical protein [Roseobacter sp. TSBP12]KAB6716277.1 hypothetical protein C8029_10365 [Roseobacter sp. TSBP12]
MATAKTNIVGPIEMPDGSKPGSGVISFQLNKWDVELGQAVVAGAAESYALDVDGNFSAMLWPPESGVNGRLYNVSLHYVIAGLNGPVSKTENLGPISFSGPGPLEIMSLLGQDIEEPTAPSVLALALSAQAAATAAAGSAQVNADQVAAIAAQFGDVAGAITAAEAAQDKSEQWAENPEDVEVDPGQYSAKHHAAKASKQKDIAAAHATTANESMALAEAAAAMAETYAGVVDRATSVAGLEDPATLADGDQAIVSGSGDIAVDGLYEVQTGAWVRIGDSGLGGKSDKTANAASAVWRADVSGTANAIILTLTDCDLTNAQILASKTRILFTPTAANTAAPTATVAGVTRDLVDYTGGAMKGGEIQPGRSMIIRPNLPGATFIVEFNAADVSTINHHLARSTSVAYSNDGTYDIYTLTTPRPVSATDGTLVSFQVPQANTGPAKVVLNGSSYLCKHGANEAFSGGEFKLNRHALLRFAGPPQSAWGLIASGVTTADLDAVIADTISNSDRIALLEAIAGIGSFADEARTLTTKIMGVNPLDVAWPDDPRNPVNFYTWNDGVRTKAAARTIKIGASGDSIDTGATAEGGAAGPYAPAQLLADRASDAFGLMQNVEFAVDMKAVGGTVISQFLAQIQGTVETDHDIWVGFNPMNSGGKTDMDGQSSYPSMPQDLLEIVAEIRGRGGMPFLSTTEHPHLARGGAQDFPDTHRQYWPYLSYSVTATHAFDAVANTISGPFETYSFGGEAIGIGSRLSVATGDCAGTYTVTARSGGTVTVLETIPVTTSYSVLVRMVELDEETTIWPPDSDSVVIRDWTGNGIPTPGLRTYGYLNNSYRLVADLLDVALLDIEKATFAYVLEPYWATGSYDQSTLYDVLYGPVAYNHKLAEHYTNINGRVMAKLIRHIEEGTLQQNRVIW